jgi:hypothetical protein
LRARDYGVGITDFVIAVVLDSFRRMIMDMPTGLRNRVIAPVRVNVPVNLRQFWPSPTLRNFFVSVEPEIDPRLGDWAFDEVVDRVQTHMRYEVDQRNLARRIARNVKGETRPLARLMPLAVKNVVLPALYTSLAEKQFTTGLSNLGRTEMPQHLSPHIRRFDFIPPPAMGEKVKAAMIGWKDRVHLTFGRLVRPSIAELYVFRRLVGMGIPVKVESN